MVTMFKKVRLFFLFLYLTVVTGTVGLIISLFRPFNPDNVWLTCQLLGRPMLNIMGLKYLIRNKEILDSHRPCIFVSNHQNNIDLIAGALTIPHRTVSLGKTSIFFIPLFGQFYWLSGNMLISRKNKKKAIESMEKVTSSIKNKKISVWIMPEGTRSRGRGLMPFKKGAFRTAIEAGVPIVPICFNSYHLTADFNKVKSGIIACQVLSPIETKNMTKEDADSLSANCFNLMSKAVFQLDKEFPLS